MKTRALVSAALTMLSVIFTQTADPVTLPVTLPVTSDETIEMASTVQVPEHQHVTGRVMSELTPNDNLILEQSYSDQYDILCLAMTIYHEARGSTRRDQRAVGFVTINRAESDNYPDQICEVVWQEKQFSWTKDGKTDYPSDRIAWEKAKRTAYNVWSGSVEDETGGRTHFYSASSAAAPAWVSERSDPIEIGSHIYVFGH